MRSVIENLACDQELLLIVVSRKLMVYQNSIFSSLIRMVTSFVCAHTFCALLDDPTNSGLPPVTKIFLILWEEQILTRAFGIQKQNEGNLVPRN